MVRFRVKCSAPPSLGKHHLGVLVLTDNKRKDIVAQHCLYFFRERGPAIAGLKRPLRSRCKLGCYVRREVLGRRWGNSITPPSPKVPSHGRQSDSLLCQTGSMEAALCCVVPRCHWAAGCSSCEVRYSLTNVSRSCGEAASCPVDLKLFA